MYTALEATVTTPYSDTSNAECLAENHREVNGRAAPQRPDPKLRSELCLVVQRLDCELRDLKRRIPRSEMVWLRDEIDAAFVRAIFGQSGESAPQL